MLCYMNIWVYNINAHIIVRLHDVLDLDSMFRECLNWNDFGLISADENKLVALQGFIYINKYFKKAQI